MDARLHLVGLFGPVAEIHITRCDRRGAVGLHLDAIEVHARTIDREPRFHVRPHRHVVLDRDGAAGESRRPVVAPRVRDAQVEVGRDNPPRHLVIVVGEPAAPRAEIPQRRREPLRSVRLVVVVRELGKIVDVGPLLHEHVPIGHLDRRDRDLAGEHGRPVERHRQVFRRKEGPIRRL